MINGLIFFDYIIFLSPRFGVCGESTFRFLTLSPQRRVSRFHVVRFLESVRVFGVCLRACGGRPLAYEPPIASNEAIS